jgi:hypothetical protein
MLDAPFVLTGQLSAVASGQGGQCRSCGAGPGRECLPWAGPGPRRAASSCPGTAMPSTACLNTMKEGQGRQPAPLLSCLLPAGYPAQSRPGAVRSSASEVKAPRCSRIWRLCSGRTSCRPRVGPDSDCVDRGKREMHGKQLLAQLYPPKKPAGVSD